MLFGVPFHDFQNVHIHRRALIEKMSLDASSSFLAPEMLYKCYLQGASFIEVPIRFIVRTAGQPKGIRLRAIMRALRDIWLGWLRFGMSVRRAARNERHHRRIFRLSEAPFMDAEDIRLAAPLFRYYRPPEQP